MMDVALWRVLYDSAFPLLDIHLINISSFKDTYANVSNNIILNNQKQ